MVGFFNNVYYGATGIYKSYDIDARLKEVVDSYEPSITDMAKNMDEPDCCPFGALKSSSGKIYDVKPIDISNLKDVINIGSEYRNNLNKNSIILLISAIIAAIAAVVLTLGVFLFAIPIVVAASSIAVTLILFATPICMGIKLSYQIEDLCMAHVLFYQKIAHDLINYRDFENEQEIKENNYDAPRLKELYTEISNWMKKQISAIDINITDYDFLELQKYANANNIYFFDGLLPEETRKDFPQLMPTDQCLKQVYEIAIREGNDRIINMIKEPLDKYTDAVKIINSKLTYALTQICREQQSPQAGISYQLLRELKKKLMCY